MNSKTVCYIPLTVDQNILIKQMKKTQMFDKPSYKILSLLVKKNSFLAAKQILHDVLRPLKLDTFSISEVTLQKRGSKGWYTVQPLP